MKAVAATLVAGVLVLAGCDSEPARPEGPAATFSIGPSSSTTGGLQTDGFVYETGRTLPIEFANESNEARTLTVYLFDEDLDGESWTPDIDDPLAFPPPPDGAFILAEATVGPSESTEVEVELDRAGRYAMSSDDGRGACCWPVTDE